MNLQGSLPHREQGTMDKQPQPAATTSAADLTGQILGDFRVLRRLGQGGMGQVYLAEQISLKRKVALKLLRSDLAANEVSLARFKNEAEAVARATHANIVQVYAIGESNGLHFMALEYVEGRNLREYLEKKGPPEILLALSIMRQVASALQRASELGIIHRDIKPENILLTRKGEAKVADFGLVRCFADDGQPLNLTRAGVSMGTPLYMSPEQVECKTVDQRTDIYSFGVTCYHMLAGQPPFKGDNPFEVAVKHVQEMPAPLAQIRPDLPAELCALVHKMMAKKPEERIQTGREIVHELVRLRDALVGISGTGLAISMGPAPSQPLDAVYTQTLPRYRPGRRLAWLGVLFVLLALGGGLLAGWLWNRPPATAAIDFDRARIDAAQKQREQDLRALAQKHLKDGNPRQITASLDHAIELGLLFLKQRRLPEANEFFKELNQPGNKFQFRNWGKLGQAMVLAFENKPADSYKQFQLVFIPDAKGKKVSQFWNDPAIREMLAEALSFNLANAPGDFPKNLRRFLQPPAAVLKQAGK
jgi:serine/threonine-protein kinase